jgi:hypothetical protein
VRMDIVISSGSVGNWDQGWYRTPLKAPVMWT